MVISLAQGELANINSFKAPADKLQVRSVDNILNGLLDGSFYYTLDLFLLLPPFIHPSSLLLLFLLTPFHYSALSVVRGTSLTY